MHTDKHTHHLQFPWSWSICIFNL